jgi:hypothetical protein
MRVLPQKKKYIFFLITTIILLAPFLIFKVNAQDGTGYAGLVLSPHKGHDGDTVQISLDLNTWASINNDRATPNLYSKKTFTLVWDIGGWTNNEISALPDVIMKTSQWERIGSATFDSNGHLTGTATIPNRNEVGDHLLYAINEDGLQQGSTMDYWWGFFEILPGIISANTPTSTPTPTSSPIITHPDQCQLKVSWDNGRGNVSIDGTNRYPPFNAMYPYGTTVTINGTPDETHFGVTITISDSSGTHSNSGSTATINMDNDKSVSVTFGEQPQGFEGIPGFPIESIIIGLLLALTLLYITKKKTTVNLHTPR